METSSPKGSHVAADTVLHESTTPDDAKKAPKKGLSFWMIMLSLCITCFLSALDLTAISTAIPTIAADLQVDNFSWIASSYALSSTVFIPIFAGLAQVFGRKYILLSAIVIFAIGSAVCGAATTAGMMIAGRTVAGVGGGGTLAGIQIVIADLVPLAERGVYNGLLGLVWAIASAIGPVMGGILADADWRWLFYLNLPIAGLALALVTVFMHLRIPSGTMLEKLGRVDWIGSGLFLLSSSSIILGLTFGGNSYAWRNAATLVPLIGGIGLLALFVWIEARFVAKPIFEPRIFTNRTTVAGYLTTLLHGIVVMGCMFFLPVFFQMRGHSGVQSGIDLFPIAFLVAPFAIFAGISVRITGRYRPQNIVVWIFCIAGSGLLLLLDADASWMTTHAVQTLLGIGLGIGYTVTAFAILAPLPPALNAQAVGAQAFVRSFGQVLGITIGSTAFSNQMAKKLPAEYLAHLPSGASSAITAVRSVKTLEEPLRRNVQIAFAESLTAVWYILIGLSTVGLFVSFAIKGLPLNATTDESWGIAEEDSDDQASKDIELGERA